MMLFWTWSIQFALKIKNLKIWFVLSVFQFLNFSCPLSKPPTARRPALLADSGPAKSQAQQYRCRDAEKKKHIQPPRMAGRRVCCCLLLSAAAAAAAAAAVAAVAARRALPPRG
jgi:hypothetical protein